MTYLNQITHQDKIVEEKVNFFADYFNYANSQSEKSDNLDIENYLSLIEKMIFQLNTNLEKCNKYIDSYLSHPLLHKDNAYFRQYRNYLVVNELFENYKKEGKPTNKIKWIKDNPNFKISLVRFSVELKKFMFKKSLKSIISYLKCTHSLSHHKAQIIHHTHILTSEFLYANWSKEDVAETFRKIITSDVNSFPFPKSLIKENKDNLLNAKQHYVENRTFDMQFEGIFNYLRQRDKSVYYIYRIYNIQAYKGFRFKYSQVTFYEPTHPKLKNLRTEIKEAFLSSKFFDRRDMIIAAVKIRTKSKYIGEQLALKIIREELAYLDLKCNTNTLLEPFSYLTTEDFKKLSSKWRQKENTFSILEQNKKIFENNPFFILKEAGKECRNHFLKYEFLYIKAQTSRNPEDYWHYFETLFKICKQDTGNIINIISDVLLLSADQNEKVLIKLYIYNSFGNSSAEYMNMRPAEFHKLRSKGLDAIDLISKNTRHPFLSHLSNKKNKSVSKQNLRSYYSRLLWECYAQRNSMIHNNEQNEKTLISIYLKLPSLVSRFRDTLIKTMKENNQLNFVELIDKIRSK